MYAFNPQLENPARYEELMEIKKKEMEAQARRQAASDAVPTLVQHVDERDLAPILIERRKRDLTLPELQEQKILAKRSTN